jgi:hypothetical protein
VTTPQSTLEVASAARTAQLGIRARLMVDVAKLWPLLDRKNVSATFPGWLEAMKSVTRLYHRESSAAAGAAYRQAREVATLSPAPESLVRIADDPVDEWLEKAFRYSGPALLDKDTARPNTALSTTIGTASRIAQDGGRVTTLETTAADPVALGWYRVTGPNPCAFCALLASRGIVYHGDAFDRSDARFHGEGEFKVHNHCSCILAPAFSRDQELPASSKVALDVYRHRGKGPALPAFRKAWAEHTAAAQ